MNCLESSDLVGGSETTWSRNRFWTFHCNKIFVWNISSAVFFTGEQLRFSLVLLPKRSSYLSRKLIRNWIKNQLPVGFIISFYRFEPVFISSFDQFWQTCYLPTKLMSNWVRNQLTVGLVSSFYRFEPVFILGLTSSDRLCIGFV